MLLALVLLMVPAVSEPPAGPPLDASSTGEPQIVLRSSSLPAAPSSLLDVSAEPNASASRTSIEPVITPAAAPTPQKHPAASKRTWVGLAIALHSSAAFDAWTTRRQIATGRYHESNPILKPFANNNSLYAVVQLTPAALDLLGNRMRKSQRPWVRRLWWVPQATQTATHLVCGATNLTK